MNSAIKLALATVSLSLSLQVAAECTPRLPVENVISIPLCDPSKQKCISTPTAIARYAKAYKDNPHIFSIIAQASPWHLFDGDSRILRISEIAAMIQKKRKKIHTSVELLTDWSGVQPSRDEKSLAQKLSKELQGFPVKGQNGFVWLTKDGTIKTTRQAFTTMNSKAAFEIAEGDDVMVSLASARAIFTQDQIIAAKDGLGVLQIAIGMEAYLLCPDSAVEYYVMAAQLGNPIAAYNLAIIQLEANTKASMKQAIEWLQKAANLGDLKAKEVLLELANQQ